MIKPNYSWDDKFMLNREEKAKIPPSALFLQVGWERDEVILKDPNMDHAKDQQFLA